MANKKFVIRDSGKFKQADFLVTSTGVGDANRPVSTGTDGKLDPSVMPTGIGAATIAATASETLGAGKLVNLWVNAGVFSARLADNSNGREANGYVKDAAASAAPATVYPLDSINTAVSGLTIGSRYWLGTAGGVIATPLDATDVANANKVCQYIGIAKSATELITEDSDPVIL